MVAITRPSGARILGQHARLVEAGFLVTIFAGGRGKMRIPPAMAAKVTDRFWTFADLMAEWRRCLYDEKAPQLERGCRRNP
jgi:hypothetical protein